LFSTWYGTKKDRIMQRNSMNPTLPQPGHDAQTVGVGAVFPVGDCSKSAALLIKPVNVEQRAV
jgi:hypothetical protein